ncbi:MAG: methylated-DNA--[protein]-cysteine S-methyltransferase [Shimia sp.]
MKVGLDSPFGPLVATLDGGEITQLTWGQAPWTETPLSRRLAEAIAAYADDPQCRIDLPLRLAPPGLTREVQRALLAIPSGETRIYGDLAQTLGVPAQAIGQACGANTLPILVPCHRVLSATGLGGYSGAGGIETKVALLRHEGAAGLLI